MQENTKVPTLNTELRESEAQAELDKAYKEQELYLDPHNMEIIRSWDEKRKSYKEKEFVFKVRDKELRVETHTKSLSHLDIPKITLPSYRGWGDILKWVLRENVPGEFPFASGVFPFKREGEDPTRQFAGEGGPERTNRRFHYLSFGMPAIRLCGTAKNIRAQTECRRKVVPAPRLHLFQARSHP